MANPTQLFKDDEDEKTRPSVSDNELRHITGIGPDEEGAMDREAGSGAKEDVAKRERLAGNTTADDTGKAKADSGELHKSEAKPSDTIGPGYKPEGKGKRKKKSLKSKILKHKAMLIGGGGGLLGIIAILVLLLLLASSLKLPDVAQNITNYEFARVTRLFSDNAQRASDEALSEEALNDSTWSALKAKYTAGYDNIRASTWGKLDNFRPSQVIKTLGDKDNAALSLNFKSSSIPGRAPIFVSAEINGQLIPMEPPSGISRWVPGLRQIAKVNNEADFVQKFYPALDTAMENQNVGSIIRNVTSGRLRKLLGISLIGWNVGKFKGDTPEQAQVEEAKETVEAVDEETPHLPDNATTAEITDAENSVEAAEQATLNSDTAIEKTIASGGIAPAVDSALINAIKSSLTKSVLGAIDPLYAIATPICIVYDGSVQQSGPTITNQVDQQEAAYYHYASAADQQKNGTLGADDDPVALDNAISATNDQLGDITKSYPILRATNGFVDTSDTVSVEAGSDGSFDFSLINAAGLSGTAASVANYIVGHFCGALTSTASAVGIGILNIGATIISFGGTEAGEEAAGQGAAAFIKAFVSDAVSNIFKTTVEKDGVNTIERSALSRAYKFAFRQGLTVGGTVGATELASLIVANRAGQSNNGFAQGTDAVDEADSGANINAGETCRIQLFCRPLTQAEVCQSNTADVAFLNEQTEKESLGQRYLSTDNAQSLLSRTATAVGGLDNGSIGSSILKLSSVILKPITMIGSILNIFTARAYAASDCSADTTDYGNVQFGWSQAEENLIDSNTSYAPLENQKILDTNGNEAKIATEYAVCFGWKYDSGGNGDFDPTDTSGDLQPDMTNGALGSLLSSGDITRDSHGNVNQTGGLCSPQNLGPDNSKYGAQMVFRWRLAMSYDSTLDQLTNLQSVSN